MFALVRLAAELAEQLVAIELGGEDTVHQARTRVRRLRSVLGVYHRAFDQTAAADLRRRLRGLGQALGDARDLEVRAAELENLVSADGTPEVVEAVTAFALDAQREYDAAERALFLRLRGRAHRILLADLQAFAADPPLRKKAVSHPDRLIANALDRALWRVRRLTSADEPAEWTLEQRHELRKSTRRLRYAAEAVADSSPSVNRLATEAEAVQDALGDNRDLLLLAEHLRDRSAVSGLGPSATAGVARLAAQREAEAAGILAPLASHLKELDIAPSP
ncbi:MAG: CHAD domain-containing protein [Leifsonia sp.]